MTRTSLPLIDLQENIGKLFQGVVQFSPGTLQQGGGLAGDCTVSMNQPLLVPQVIYGRVQTYVLQSAKA